MIVLDTNVVSELMRSAPNAAVVRWLKAHPDGELFTTSISQAEILRGIEIIAKGKRREALRAEAEAIFEADFAGRLLSFGSGAARAYAALTATRRKLGKPISIFDAQIAAIALANRARVATRDVDGFSDCGIAVVNPWD